MLPCLCKLQENLLKRKPSLVLCKIVDFILFKNFRRNTVAHNKNRDNF